MAATCLILPLHMGPGIETGGIIFSLLPPTSMKDKRWVLLARVSSDDQLDNTSTDKQLSDLRERTEELSGSTVDEIERAESGAQMDRKSLNEILEMGKNDEFDILGIWKLDRLTRSDPWESINYLQKLRKHGIVLYSHNHGFFDWEDRKDFEIMVREVLFSREWYSRIKENAEDGQLKYLKQGKYPFGEPHWGYTTDDEKYIALTERGKSVIPDLFDNYVETENRAEARRIVNDERGLEDNPLTDSQAKTILESPLCIGQLTLKGKVVNTKAELQCVSNGTFNQAQEILEDRRRSSSEGEVVPEPVERAEKRFGPEFIGNLFDTLNTICPESGCDGVLEETNSTTTVRNRILVEYTCEECDFTGPLFDQREIDKLDATIPLACPFCVSVDDVSAEKVSSSVLEYLYTCTHCQNKFAVDVPPNKYQRAFERPEVAFRWNPHEDQPSEDADEVDPEDTVFIWGMTKMPDGGDEDSSNSEKTDDDDDESASPMCTVD
jgi:site-specific DNA recombinase